MNTDLRRAYRVDAPKVPFRFNTRVAGAWTRLGGADGLTPMGRLHAVHRVNGALEERALCGYKIPARALRLRPFAIFDASNPKACETCLEEVRDL